ncbi:MAG TPA: FAD-dependent oxidoreductase [Streptosporangiaceae bacterium]
MEQVDIAVVGAGVIGSATARALGARGVSAVLLEQFDLGHARGSSHGATRIFRLSYPDPGYVRMTVAARQEWARLQDDADEELLLTTGGLDAGPAAAGCAAALSECGVPHTWLTAGEVAERFPGIAARPGERMLLQDDAGVLLAGRTVAALQRLARRDGVDIRPQTPVLGIEPREGHVRLSTSGGEISARAAVIAAGAWCAGLLAGAVARVPRLTATLQSVRYFSPRAPGDDWPTLIDWTSDSMGWYVVPAADGAPGVKVASHAAGPVVDPRQEPFAMIDRAPEDAAAQYVRERLPGLVPDGLGAENCLYTMTADDDFVLDREGPVVVGGGGSGHAFKFGPLLGEMLADLALGQDTRIPRLRFALTRPAL